LVDLWSLQATESWLAPSTAHVAYWHVGRSPNWTSTAALAALESAPYGGNYLERDPTSAERHEHCASRAF
jgi:hypothetical protein